MLVEDAVYRHEKRTAEEIAEDTGLPLDEVERIVQRSFLLSRSVATQEKCAKCRKELAQPGSTFCIACRLELHEALGLATEELSDGLVYEPEYPTHPTGLLSAIEQKRDRANTTLVARRRQRVK